ncbi:MAG: tetratricopeptide repeat protein [Coriobacteriia bacterium]|nr:tetratricopeptide repeat protein [Coriobacteriia bacterium]
MVEITEEDISTDSGGPRKRASARRPRSLWHDPVATTLVLAIALVVIGALLTAVFAVLNGSISLGAAPPATFSAAMVQQAQGSVKTDNDAASFQKLITTQVDNGDIPGALVSLQNAKRQKFDLTQTQMIDFCQAYIDQSSGQTDAAVKLYQQVMTNLMKAYETEKAKGGDTNWALAYGVPNNYYISASQLAYIFQSGKDYNNVVKYLTLYLSNTSGATDASALIDRGNAYLLLGQKNKAKQDFQNALKYIPDDADATAGLKKAEGK